MDYEKVYDGLFLEDTFNRLHAHVGWLLAMFGVGDVVVQKFLLVAVIAALLWLFARRLSTVGYRVSLPVGVVVQTFTLGPVLTFLFVAIPAWIAFRQVAIANALRAVLVP